MKESWLLYHFLMMLQAILCVETSSIFAVLVKCYSAYKNGFHCYLLSWYDGACL